MRHGGDKGNHSRGFAVDVQLFDKQGNKLTNIQGGGKYARDYEKFYQNGVAWASQYYPDLPNRARWGGYFSSGPDAADYMHLDVTPGRSSLGGNLVSGATSEQLTRFGGTSQGLIGGTWQSHLQSVYSGINIPQKEIMSSSQQPPVNVFEKKEVSLHQKKIVKNIGTPKSEKSPMRSDVVDLRTMG